MFEIEFFEEDPIMIEAYSFDVTAGNIVFYNKAGVRFGYFNKDVVKSVLPSNK